MDLSGSGRILHVEELRILHNLQQRLLELPNTKGEMDGTRGKHATQKKFIHNFGGKYWRKKLLEKWIFTKLDGRLWNQSTRLKTEQAVSSYEHVTNLMFLHNAQKLLIGWETVRFSVEILLYGIICTSACTKGQYCGSRMSSYIGMAGTSQLPEGQRPELKPQLNFDTQKPFSL